MIKKKANKPPPPKAKRSDTEKARDRVLKVARKEGHITNRQAAIEGGWPQAWYHLTVMVKAGQLKKAGFNRWRPVK